MIFNSRIDCSFFICIFFIYVIRNRHCVVVRRLDFLFLFFFLMFDWNKDRLLLGSDHVNIWPLFNL